MGSGDAWGESRGGVVRQIVKKLGGADDLHVVGLSVPGPTRAVASGTPEIALVDRKPRPIPGLHSHSSPRPTPLVFDFLFCIAVRSWRRALYDYRSLWATE